MEKSEDIEKSEENYRKRMKKQRKSVRKVVEKYKRLIISKKVNGKV